MKKRCGKFNIKFKTTNIIKNYMTYMYIADNCTDNTAKVAREAGAIVYEKFDETNKKQKVMH